MKRWQHAGLLTAPAYANSVSFNGIQNGAKVGSPVHLEFVANGVEVRPAAEGLSEGMAGFHCSREKSNRMLQDSNRMHTHGRYVHLLQSRLVVSCLCEVNEYVNRSVRHASMQRVCTPACA
jgi:hypothetical protein